MKKLIAALALTGGIAVATPVEAHHYSEIWLGEFQSCQNVPLCRDHLVPPTRLNIDMYDGNLNGVNPVVRCENKGGIPHWHYSWHYTCLDVDY